MKSDQGHVGRGVGWVLLSMLLCLHVGCKKEDRDPPAVALSAPNDGFAILADSEFVIQGVASDDQGLSSITASLAEMETGLLVQSKTVTLTGLSSPFSFEMAAGDRYTATGTYILKVTASDRGQNMGSAFTQIHIQELPLAYRGAVWAGDQSSGNYALYKLDTAGAVHQGVGMFQNMSDLLADNRNGQLIGVQSMPGALRAWGADDLDQLFQFDLPQGSGTATYAGISMNHNRYYGALKVSLYVRAYRFDGTEVNGFEQALHPATAVLATDARVYAGLQGVVGLPMKLDAYDASTGALIATLPLDWPVEGILPLNDAQLLVWGNDAGVGQLVIVDRVTMQAVHETTVSAPLVAACTANGRAWVLTDQGLYEFFASSATLSGLLAAGSYASLAVDATLNRLLLGGQGVVELRTGAGSLLQSIPGAFGEVKFIDVLYNK